jgi:hypothetical protein
MHDPFAKFPPSLGVIHYIIEADGSIDWSLILEALVDAVKKHKDFVVDGRHLGAQDAARLDGLQLGDLLRAFGLRFALTRSEAEFLQVSEDFHHDIYETVGGPNDGMQVAAPKTLKGSPNIFSSVLRSLFEKN